jgi:hypothetical protein
MLQFQETRKKEAKKVLKYKDLTVEIYCVWDVKTNVISVITGATELSPYHSENT